MFYLAEPEKHALCSRQQASKQLALKLKVEVANSIILMLGYDNFYEHNTSIVNKAFN